MTRLLMASNSAWNLAHFRAPLLDWMRRSGVQVIALVPEGDNAGALKSWDIDVRRIRLARAGVSPFGDARLLADYLREMRQCRPDAFLGFTAKPNIYGSLAARWLGVPTINNISGLGTGFMRDGFLQQIMTRLYRSALRKSAVVFFQNEDDRSLFVERGMVRPEQSRLLPGSGIDLDRFAAAPMPSGDREINFLLVARMLDDKGVREFVGAARLLKDEGVRARWTLLGPADDENRTAIGAEQLRAWQEEGIVDWLGYLDDVRPAMIDADVVVLPSYREGMPRSLIEAGAMGRPVIATDVPGCRQAVVAGKTGLLCEARSVPSLANAMREMATMGSEARARFGAANRRRAEVEFGEAVVVDAYRHALAACGIELPA